MEVGLCLCALNAALANSGHIPEIFNTDQGCQFTSAEWTSRLLELDVRISMDGKGRWMDNVFIERLWRSVKYEEIYLHEHSIIPVLKAGLNRWFHRYNTWRPHQTLVNLTPQASTKTGPKPLRSPWGPLLSSPHKSAEFRHAFWKPPLQAPQPTPLRSVVCSAFRSSFQKSPSCPQIHTSPLPPPPRRSTASHPPLYHNLFQPPSGLTFRPTSDEMPKFAQSRR